MHTLPAIPMNPYLNTLLTALPAQSVLSLFVSILYERRIILASTRLSVLTGVAHAFNTLLYPLSWQVCAVWLDVRGVVRGARVRALMPRWCVSRFKPLVCVFRRSPGLYRREFLF